MANKKNISAFQDILSQVKPQAGLEPETEAQPTVKKQSKKKASTKAPAPLPQGKRGGKSSDPNFTQATLYVRKDTHHNVKLRLLQENLGRDMSDLAEQLFSEWLKSNK
ncbi:MAG: hypothetical protein AB7H86_04025 [Blastocatellales bacterium]